MIAIEGFFKKLYMKCIEKLKVAIFTCEHYLILLFSKKEVPVGIFAI